MYLYIIPGKKSTVWQLRWKTKEGYMSDICIAKTIDPKLREILAQKVIEGGIASCRHMHEILRWFNFKLAQNLRSRVKTPRWLTFSDQKLWDSSKFEQKLESRYWLLRILSHLRVSGLKKVSHLGVLTRHRRFWANLKLSHLKISCICLHVTIPPSITFWAISRTPAYSNSNLNRK